MLRKHSPVNDLEDFRDIADDVEESEFVPFASLYDEHTVLTKNGELMQTLRVTGLSYENLRQESLELRRTLRETIRSTLPDDSFALWFHTIRLEHDLTAPGKPPEGFSAELSKAWIEKNKLRKQFSNEVFVTVVHEGQDASILSGKVFLRGLFPRLDLKWRNAFLDGIHRKLDTVVLALEKKLETYGAERLGMARDDDGVYRSELLRFLNKIINFVDQPVPVLDHDLSKQLTPCEITFGYNAMEVRGADGRRRFATILTTKEYKEKALPYIDRFLKLPMEFVVTQCVSFIRPKDALDTFKKQKKYVELGETGEMARLTELDDILESDNGRITDFGEQQLSIFLVADSIRQLERNVRHAVHFLSRHGIVVIREDLKFEECYWAQLPGNFEFVARMLPAPTQHMAGFANLYNHPVGIREHNRWGPAVTTFHTASGAPYFFNFHAGESGHTVIVGQPHTGKHVLANFLISESMKFAPRVIYLDSSNRYLEFIDRLGGESHILSPALDGPPVPLNPFSLPPTEGNRRFLSRWLTVLLRSAGQPVGDDDKAAIGAGLDAVYADGAPRRMSRYLDHLTALGHGSTSGKFALWREGGAYGHLFDHDTDILDDTGHVTGLHIARILPEAALSPAVCSYLLQKATVSLTGKPSILMLDEGFHLLGQTHIAADTGAWLDHLTAKNAVAILTTGQVEDAGSRPFTPTLMTKAATQVYFPDSDPDEIYMEGFGLTELEFSYLDVIEVKQHHFLMRRLENTIIGEFDMSGLDEWMAVLSGEALVTGEEKKSLWDA